MTKIIGLTGGIGSGKTTVAVFFKELGVPVYIADIEAKKIMESAGVVNSVKNEFGDIVIENNQINRKKLAEIVFSNYEKLQKLNGIVHPLVKRHFEQWVEKHRNHPFVIKEAAILFESGSFVDCDKIITVVAPIQERIERVKSRDLIGVEGIMGRIDSQWTDEMRIGKSDFVIENSDLLQTKKQVKTLFDRLKYDD
ncbi:MAG: dephospho-CoA kinase [Flavobacterium sp.]